MPSASTRSWRPAPSTAPVVRTLVDEELAYWLAKASADGGRDRPCRSSSGRPASPASAWRRHDDTVYVPWAAGRPDYTALEEWLGEPRAQDVLLREAAVQGAEPCRAHRRRSRVRHPHRRLAAAAGVRPADARRPGLRGARRDAAASPTPTSSCRSRMRSARPPRPGTSGASPTRRRSRSTTAPAPVLDEIELPLVAVLAEMELTGVTIDTEVLARLRGELTDKANDYAARAYAEIGHEVNLGSPKQLQQVLFDELQMPKTRVHQDRLLDRRRLPGRPAGVRTRIPFLGLLLQHRDATKLKQIVETLERSVESDGRIHTTYDQTGTTTGRISSNDPNLQNIPVRTEEGREIRSAFEQRRRVRDPAHRRLLADRDAHHGAPLRRRRAHRGVQRRAKTFTASSARASSASTPAEVTHQPCAPRSRRCPTVSPTG